MQPAPTPQSAPGGADASGNAEQAYQQALNLLQRGRYPEAATALEQFIATYPGSPYAANATYWLGETYYVSRQYDKARSAFQTVIQRYPQSDKVPDAWLKVGFVYYELQQWQNARQALQRVLASYPGTNAAQLAQARLKKMQQDGVLR
jgi:tol-pal system protein YbgF